MAEEKTENNENIINENSIQTTEENIVTESVQEIIQNPTETSNDEQQNIIEEVANKNKHLSLKKILIIIIGILGLLIIIGFILYFVGVFDAKEEEHITEENTATTTVVEEPKKEVETYKFDIKDINSKKLNEQLAALTNKNINQDKEEEKEKVKDENKLIEEKNIEEEKIRKEKQALIEKKLLLENEKAQLEALKQEATVMKNKLAQNNINADHLKIEDAIDKNNLNKESTSSGNSKHESHTINSVNELKFLKFISVAKIKGQLYKKYLDKVISINPDIHLCRDDKNRIELFYGPFEDEDNRVKLLEKLKKSGFTEAYELEFTKEEFDTQCNY